MPLDSSNNFSKSLGVEDGMGIYGMGMGMRMGIGIGMLDGNGGWII